MFRFIVNHFSQNTILPMVTAVCRSNMPTLNIQIKWYTKFYCLKLKNTHLCVQYFSSVFQTKKLLSD